MNLKETPTTPRGVSGKKVLLISLIACVAIPFVAFFIPVLMIESGKEPAAALDWSQRDTWEIVPVRSRVLRWGDTPRPPFEGREVSELPFEVSLQEASAVYDLASIARQWNETGKDPATIQRSLDAETFYQHYLFGRWHARNGDPELAEQHLTRAYSLAPKALVWRFVDQTGRPLADQPIGDIELIMVRLHDDKLNEGLRLVYPDMTTDGDGRVWLPVYDTVYAFGTWGASEMTGLPNKVAIEHESTQWFESPGQVGSLPDAVVRE